MKVLLIRNCFLLLLFILLLLLLFLILLFPGEDLFIFFCKNFNGRNNLVLPFLLLVVFLVRHDGLLCSDDEWSDFWKDISQLSDLFVLTTDYWLAMLKCLNQPRLWHSGSLAVVHRAHLSLCVYNIYYFARNTRNLPYWLITARFVGKKHVREM